jgi:hypothetical protein
MTYRYVNISGRPAQITADQTRTRARNIVPGRKSKTLHEISSSDICTAAADQADQQQTRRKSVSARSDPDAETTTRSETRNRSPGTRKQGGLGQIKRVLVLVH